MNNAQFLELNAKVARSCINVIDAISTRGVFKGEELFTVGELRNQCVSVIKEVEERQQQEEDDE